MSEPGDPSARSRFEATGAAASVETVATSAGPPVTDTEQRREQPPRGPDRREHARPGRPLRQRSRSINVDVLARVEGEGAFTVRVRRGAVTESSLRIYEPPRFFEALLRGRHFTEAPDITARICGICPVAYQMSAVQAMEAACGVAVTGQLRALRRLLYCGEWIESHALHVHLLHAPDFLGYDSSIHMARDHAAVVNRGLQLKKIGNEIVRLLGGREIHPVNVRVGGFYRVPERRDFTELEEGLKWALDAALQTARWVSTFRFPAFERTYRYVALRHPSEYAVLSGEIVSSDGLNLPVSRYEQSFAEYHVPRSTALHSTMSDHGSYLVGPLARYNLNFDHLAPLAQNAAIDSGLGRTCHNPFKSIVVRSVETIQAIVDALEIIAAYERPDRPFVDMEPRPATGQAATEAPRGLLYHRYRVSVGGTNEEARIVPPTAQNQGVIEADLRAFVEQHLDLDERTLTWQCEQTVRNYDPCISCATHFLRLHLTRE